jgi:hypothetical protein
MDSGKLTINENWPIKKQQKLKNAFKAFSKHIQWMSTIDIYIHCPQNLNELFQFNINCDYCNEFKKWSDKYNLDYIWVDEETVIVADNEIYT